MKSYEFRFKSDNYVTLLIFANNKEEAYKIISENQLHHNKNISDDWLYCGVKKLEKNIGDNCYYLNEKGERQ